MLELRFHAFRRHRPGGRGDVHLVPPRTADFSRAAGGQHEELERERRRRVRLGDLRVRQRPLVLPAHAVLRQRGGYGVPCGVVLAVALRDRPFHHCADALPDAPRSFRLGGPDRKQHLHDVGGADAVHALAADLRHGVVAQAGAPLGGGLAAVLPVLGVDPDDLLHGLLEGRRAAGTVARVAALGDYPRVRERLLPARASVTTG